jgi:hypothetical protein
MSDPRVGLSPDESPTPAEQSPLEVMLLLIGGFWMSRAISAAASLGLADWLKERPRTLTELAELTGTHPPSLYRLLRVLTSVGIFEENQPKQFQSTPLGSTLESGSPGSVRALAVGQLGSDHYRAWGELLYSLKTGAPAFEKVFGMSVWDYYKRNPDNAATFQEVMTALTVVVDSAVLEAVDLADSSVIVEVGGGRGDLLCSFLSRYPDARGILHDVPDQVEAAAGRIAAAGLAGRCRVVGGDFMKSVPEGGDSYLLKWILHDWDDEPCLEILGNCFSVMQPGGRLWLIESIIPEGSAPAVSKLLDLNMLVITGGRERTVGEYRQLVEHAGFTFGRVIPTDTLVSVIECRKPIE